jgi:hypothetical protein
MFVLLDGHESGVADLLQSIDDGFALAAMFAPFQSSLPAKSIRLVSTPAPKTSATPSDPPAAYGFCGSSAIDRDCGLRKVRS